MPPETVFVNPIGKFTDLPPARVRQMEKEEKKKAKALKMQEAAEEKSIAEAFRQNGLNYSDDEINHLTQEEMKTRRNNTQASQNNNNSNNNGTDPFAVVGNSTAPRFFQNQFDLWKICHTESGKWLDCMKERAEKPKSKPVFFNKHCVDEREIFTNCVVDWRTQIKDPIPEKIEARDKSGVLMCDEEMIAENIYSPHLDPSKKVKVKVCGKEGRMLPPQCDDFRIITQRCMFQAGFETHLCRAFGEATRHCTRYLYGQEFIDEKNTAPMPMFRFYHSTNEIGFNGGSGWKNTNNNTESTSKTFSGQ